MRRNSDFKKSLKYEALPGIMDQESAWCKLFLDDVALLIGDVYRPLGANIMLLETNDYYLLQVVNKRAKLILIGDFHLPHVDFDRK